MLAAAASAAGFDLDDDQRAAARHLDRLLVELERPRTRSRRRRAAPRGAYLWGPVGRGKTWLLDAFHAAVPTTAKRRVHFHEFFQDLHAAVHAHRAAPHPFAAALDALLHDTRVLCFDELHLHDPGDAAMLTRLLEAVPARGVVLVATSNYPPHGLLPNPLFHHLFEPGIELITSGFEVFEVAGPTDYRTLAREPGTAGFASGRFVHGITADRRGWPARVRIGGCDVPAVVSGDEVTLRFADLCGAPVSALDLLAATRTHRSWVLVDVPRLAGCTPDAVQRFLHLVDVLHDRDLPLTLVADAPLEELLAGDGLPGDLERTGSRLRLLEEVAGPAS